MSESTLPLTLLGLNTNPEVVSQLLTQTTFPTERPNYWSRYPNIGADLPIKDALAFARKSVMHALTIANSEATGPATLDELSKFGQKSVKRSVAAHRGLWDESVVRLATWACRNDDQQTLDALANFQNPLVWVPVVNKLLGHTADRWSDKIARYAASLETPEAAYDLFDKLPSLESADHAQSYRCSRVEFMQLVHRGLDSSGADPVALLRRVSDKTERSILATFGIPGYYTERVVVLSDEYVHILVTDWDESLTIRGYLPWLRSARIGMSEHAVLELMAFNQQTTNQLVFSSLQYGLENWSNQILNAAVLTVGDRFLVERSVHESDVLAKAVTTITVSRLLDTTMASSWSRLGSSHICNMIGELEPETALRLALLMPPGSLERYLVTEGRTPTFTPSQFVDALTDATSAAEGKEDAGALPLNSGFSYHNTSRGDTDRVNLALCHLLTNKTVSDSWKPTAWIMEVLNLAGGVTGMHALERGTDPTYMDVWTYAVHQHFDSVIHDVPEAWIPAITLLKGWSSSLVELATLCAETAGVDVSDKLALLHGQAEPSVTQGELF